jgi:hypothetical protein
MAATRCTVCQHPQRAAIELAISAGVGHRQIAERHKVGHHAVFRHGRDHLTPELRAAMALKLLKKEGDTRAVLLSEGVSTLEALQVIRSVTYSRFLAAADCGDDRAVASLCARLHEGLQLSSRLVGELAPASKVSISSVVLHPDYMRLRNELLAVLRRHPAAQADVAVVFRRMGEQAAEEMHASVPRPMINVSPSEARDAAA